MLWLFPFKMLQTYQIQTMISLFCLQEHSQSTFIIAESGMENYVNITKIQSVRDQSYCIMLSRIAYSNDMTTDYACVHE